MASYRGIKFTDDDIVNPDDWIPAGEYNPHNVVPWLLHDNGFVVAIAFAADPSEALDEMADSGKLDRFKVDASEIGDYDDHDEELIYLGNASEPFDMQCVQNYCLFPLPNPVRSFCVQFEDEMKNRAVRAEISQ